VSHPPPADDRTERIVALWSVGAYEQLGELFEPISDALIDRLDLTGRAVLDAATGTGNTAIAAARAGGEVSAFDLTPRLLEQAARRAERDGLSIDLRVGDLLAIPFDDDTFDLVISTFGAFTADDPAACLRELVRVCRPGGAILTTAWTPTSIFEVLKSHAFERRPDLRDASPARPLAWTDPDELRRLAVGLDVDVSVTSATHWVPFDSPRAALDLAEEVSGPVRYLRAAVLDAAPAAWDEVRRITVRDWTTMARADGDRVELPLSYAVATIRVGDGPGPNARSET
jgi:SAM-dependent methyltransferase